LIAAQLRSPLAERFHVCVVATHDTISLVGRIRLAIAAYLRLWAMLLTRRIDLAQVHYGDGASLNRKIPFLLTLRLFRVPYVLSDHQDWATREYPRRTALLRWLARSVFEHARAILVLGPHWKTSYERLLRRAIPVLLVYEPCERIAVSRRQKAPPDAEMPDAQPPVRFLCIGRVGRRKGTRDLIEAAALLRERFDDFSLVIAGDGELDAMRDLVRARGLERHVLLPGWLDEPARNAALAGADVFVLPTYREGMPLSIMQAMFAGLPILSTGVDGVPVIARDGVNALILRPGDPAGLADRMERLARDGALRARMGRESLAIAERELTIETTTSDLADLFENILEGKPAAPA